MRALVTGGGGFLGSALIRQLAQSGYEISSLNRRHYPALEDLQVTQIQADIADSDAVIRAAEGCDLVFHTAAKAGVWGAFEEYYQANVVGTRNVIEACTHHRISRLIHTSSPSVVFQGSDIEGDDESLPYPERFLAPYPETKAIAEQEVLAANSSDLATVCLRPHLIWGPGDNHLTPRIIARGRAGQLRRIGDRPCLVDTIYIDNAVQAHLCAAEALNPGARCAGKAYFISNDEPVPVWQMVDRILAAADLPPVTRTISPQLAWRAGSVLETIYRLFKLKGEPRMTRFVAKELSTAHWFDISAAKNDLGYTPAVSLEQGMIHLRQWLNRPLQNR